MLKTLSPLFLLLVLLSQSIDGTAEELDRIVAIIDEDIITQSELNLRTEQVTRQLRASGTPLPQRSQLQIQLIERMVNEKIKLALAKQRGVTLSEGELDQIMAKLAQDNKLTLQQFRQALIAEGSNFERFRKQIRQEVLINRIKVKQVDNRVVVSAREVNNHLKSSSKLDKNSEYHLLHILIALPEAATPEVIQRQQKKADSLLKKLQSGTDFKELAVSFSDGQQALNGGDLGWLKADYLPTLLSDEVMTMAAGELSPVLRSSSGFHIIKLAETRGDKRFVHQVKARHILLADNSDLGNPEVEARAMALLERIKQGESFSKLAHANSDDSGSATNGGDLGWADPNNYVSSFKEMLASLEINEISEPFKSKFGWHIVQLLDRRDHDNAKEVRYNDAYKALTQRKINEEYEIWSRRIRDEAFVEIRL